VSDERSRTTATAENALSDGERDALLALRLVSRLSTNRSDGWPHTTPVWFIWDGNAFVQSLGPDRVHLRNLRRDVRVTECVDVDHRLEGSLADGAWSVVCFGEAEIVAPPTAARRLTRSILEKYLGAEDLDRYVELSMKEVEAGRRIVRVHPRRWLTWDFNKAR
jgi:PPOX class probable F420-dependent enzyme